MAVYRSRNYIPSSTQANNVLKGVSLDPTGGKGTKAKRDRISITVDDRELLSLLRAFKKMDDIASNDMKKIAQDLAEEAARNVQLMANRTNQGRIVAQSIKINKKDRAPNFTIGGSGNANVKGNAKYGELLFGTEFGGPSYFSNRGRRFPSRSPREGKGNKGYFIFPTLKMMQPHITKKWLEGYGTIINAWKGRL
jgi:hypothetical protein